MSEKQLSAQALAISADMQAALQDDDLSTSVEKDSSIYFNHAKLAGYEPEVINGLKSYERTFAAGTMNAIATVGLKAAQAETPIKEVNVTFGGAKGESFSAKYISESSGEIKGAEGQPDKPWRKFGSIRVSHETSIRGKGGDMGIAISLASAAAEAALKK